MNTFAKSNCCLQCHNPVKMFLFEFSHFDQFHFVRKWCLCVACTLSIYWYGIQLGETNQCFQVRWLCLFFFSLLVLSFVLFVGIFANSVVVVIVIVVVVGYIRTHTHTHDKQMAHAKFNSFWVFGTLSRISAAHVSVTKSTKKPFMTDRLKWLPILVLSRYSILNLWFILYFDCILMSKMGKPRFCTATDHRVRERAPIDKKAAAMI